MGLLLGEAFDLVRSNGLGRLLGLVLGPLLILVAASSVQAVDCGVVHESRSLRSIAGHGHVGECPENVPYNEVGDSVQLPTSGLTVWGKADNRTVFANGYRRGIPRPIGLRLSLHSYCLPWALVCPPAEGTVAPDWERQTGARARGVATTLPGLVMYAPYVRDIRPMASRLFSMSVIVRNEDEFSSTPTRIGYFRSTDPAVTTGDTLVGGDYVARLNPLEGRSESILLFSPSLPGTYYYAACFTSGSSEFEATGNCTAAAAVTVAPFDMDSLPWVRDGISNQEERAREHINALNQVDAAMAQRIASAPWLADGVTGPELLLLDDLVFLAKIHPTTAIPVTTIPDVSGLLLASVLKSRGRMLDNEPTWLRQIVGQPWFQDGLTGEEAALFLALSETTLSDEVFEDLLNHAYVLSDTVTLPLAGDVNLYAVSRSQERLAGALETMAVAVDSMEYTTGIPWPNPNVIMLQELEATLRSDAGGWYAGTHIVVQDTSRRLAYHEIAHYYYFESPEWLVEGMADFLMLHALREGTSAIASDITAIAETCAPHGSGTIHGWNKTEAGQRLLPILAWASIPEQDVSRARASGGLVRFARTVRRLGRNGQSRIGRRDLPGVSDEYAASKAG